MKSATSKLTLLLVCTMSLLTAGCSAKPNKSDAQPSKVTINPNPYPSTYKPIEGEPTLITNVTILDGVGNRFDNGSIYFVDGKIQAIAESGQTLDVSENAKIIDCSIVLCFHLPKGIEKCKHHWLSNGFCCCPPAT